MYVAIYHAAISFVSHTIVQLTSSLTNRLQGGAPQGYRFVDYEEVWQVDEKTGRGYWAPAKSR